MVTVKTATDLHAEFIAFNAREADIKELYAAAYETPIEVMTKGLRMCDDVKVLIVKDIPVCMWGVWTESLMTGRGQPWMIGTHYLDRYPKKFIQECKPQLMEIFDKYVILSNYVDARNKKSIRWLKWLGFDISDQPVNYGIECIPFYKFEMRLN